MSLIVDVFCWCKIPSVQVCIIEGETNKMSWYVGSLSVSPSTNIFSQTYNLLFRLGLEFPPGFNPDLLKAQVSSDVAKD